MVYQKSQQQNNLPNKHPRQQLQGEDILDTQHPQAHSRPEEAPLGRAEEDQVPEQGAVRKVPNLRERVSDRTWDYPQQPDLEILQVRSPKAISRIDSGALFPLS